MLAEKLQHLGMQRVPMTQVESRYLYSKNDKRIEQCSLVNEIHEKIRRIFTIYQPG